jgi:DNA-binding MarR family transcriptional regulator
MGPTQNIGYLLQHLCSMLAKQSDQALQERLGIGISQFKILRVLQYSPATRQRQVADWLGQTEASISRQIKLMIEKGLLHVTISPKNRREHLTTVTAKGLRMAEEAMKVLGNSQAAMYADIGEKKQQQLLSILNQMHSHACQSDTNAACHHSFQVSNNVKRS